MKIFNSIKNRLFLVVAFAFVASVLLSFARFDYLCDDLRDNVLRLHIIANSDTEQDQELKLAVRDSVLNECGYLFNDNETLEQAADTVRNNIDLFSRVAQKTILENGYNYKVYVELTDDYFDTKVYDHFTLPAGVYEALKIKIGDAKGKNWWCVMFPSVCIYSAADTRTGSLKDSTSEQSAYIAEHADRYVIKFKIVEVYERMKKLFC